MLSLDQLRQNLTELREDDPAFEQKAARLRHDLNAQAAVMVEQAERAKERLKLMGKAQVIAAMDAFLDAVEKS